MSRTSNSPTTAMRFCCLLGGPIVRDKLFFFGSWAPRDRRAARTSTRFTRSETDTIEQKQTFNSAFGKVNYDPTNRLRTSFSVLRTPTTSEGSLAVYDYLLRTRSPARRSLRPGPEDPGLRGSADQLRGHPRLHAEQLVAPQRAGGYFDDYGEHRRADLQQRRDPHTTAAGLGYPIAADQLGGVGFQNTPRIQLSEFDHTKRGYVQADFIKAFTMGGSHNFKGGVGYQHTANDVKVAYPVVRRVVYRDWSFTSNDTGRTDCGPDGYYEVDDRGVQGQTSGGYLVALRARPVDDPQPHAQSWPPHGARHDPVVSHRRSGRRVQVRVRRQARPPDRRQLRRVQRRPDEAGMAAGAAISTGTRYEVSRGAFGADVWRVRYRSLDTTDAFSLSGTNMPGRNLWNDYSVASRTSGFRTSTRWIPTSSR